MNVYGLCERCKNLKLNKTTYKCVAFDMRITERTCARDDCSDYDSKFESDYENI